MTLQILTFADDDRRRSRWQRVGSAMGSSSSMKMEWGPAVCMVLIELFTTGQMLLTKVVVDAGLFVFALLTYRFFLGTILVLPLAFILERHLVARDINWGMMASSSLKEWLPAIFMVMLQIFTAGSLMLVKVVVDGWLFVCTLLTYRYLLGAVLVVPWAVSFEKLAPIHCSWSVLHRPGRYITRYAINFYNIVPIAAFILAVLFRKEPLNMRSIVGIIKVVGALVCVGGTIIISLYKGKVLHLWPTNIIGYHPSKAATAFGHHHIRGTILLVISCLSLAVWYTAQMLKVFPYKYWSTVATCFVGSIQMAIIGVAMNREKATWKLKWNMSLLTIIYSAILNTAAKFVMISWVVTQRGPTYPSMFCAVSVLFTTILDSLLLGHDLSVGSILGMLLILAGLYLFLWGKRKEVVPETTENPKEEVQFQTGDRTSELPSNV
uniref:EamA domain-containing protein n=1 Tax=Oryza meridionalis TaxID=40149 RepID=A0A0E0EWH1_9ORYZ